MFIFSFVLLFCRIYTGFYYAWVLRNNQYVVENNLDLDISIGKMDRAIERTLSEPKAVLFDSEILVYYKMMKYDCNNQVHFWNHI